MTYDTKLITFQIWHEPYEIWRFVFWISLSTFYFWHFTQHWTLQALTLTLKHNPVYFTDGFHCYMQYKKVSNWLNNLDCRDASTSKAYYVEGGSDPNVTCFIFNLSHTIFQTKIPSCWAKSLTSADFQMDKDCGWRQGEHRCLNDSGQYWFVFCIQTFGEHFCRWIPLWPVRVGSPLHCIMYIGIMYGRGQGG